MIDDWQAVARRYEAFWAHEMYDRPLLAVTAPRARAAPRAPAPAAARPAPASTLLRDDPQLRRQWTDPDAMIRAAVSSLEATHRCGEAMPVFFHNWSAGHALLLGCEPHYAAETVWVDPSADGPEQWLKWRENPWWRWMVDATVRAAEQSRGRYFVLPTWGNHAGDNLALARGSQQLMLDLAADRAEVARAVRVVSDILLEVYEELWRIVTPERVGLPGSINYVNMWSPLKTMGFDCDVSCMVSRRDFEEVFLPPLVETMRTVDHRIYHLDGPGAIHHLDVLLDLPEVDAIQWVAGEGAPPLLSWIPLIRRVQRAGKSIAVYGTPAEVEPLLDEVAPEGLYIGVSTATVEEARDLLRRVARRFGARP